MKLAFCRSCQAPILWMKTKKGKTMPVDADSTGLDEDEIAELPDETMYEHGVHSSHLDTCPFADEHRRRK